MKLRIFLYWIIVSVPLAWGVAQSVNAALPLFGVQSVPRFLGMPATPPPVPSPTPVPKMPLPTP